MDTATTQHTEETRTTLLPPPPSHADTSQTESVTTPAAKAEGLVFRTGARQEQGHEVCGGARPERAGERGQRGASPEQGRAAGGCARPERRRKVAGGSGAA
ncbi:hypothetical protein U9M48_008865 [Paspalum notatum var. saurae]|uniref:Uncharacterized protein n=1 Tax=Paspalum notatum var. saurae TaxID=547442 RepID=A0AAQ3SQ48_PASNO